MSCYVTRSLMVCPNGKQIHFDSFTKQGHQMGKAEMEKLLPLMLADVKFQVPRSE